MTQTDYDRDDRVERCSHVETEWAHHEIFGEAECECGYVLSVTEFEECFGVKFP